MYGRLLRIITKEKEPSLIMSDLPYFRVMSFFSRLRLKVFKQAIIIVL